jgi:pilus assembly protein CpaE
VVDHDIQARFEMKQVVKASGLTVAGDSAYGMEAVTVASEVRPDIVVIGMNDPVERPLQTVESLAALLPDTPIIIYSDSKEIESARKAMLAGARDFLPRPVRPEVLRDSVLKSMEAEENRRLRKLGQVPAVRTQGTIITVFGAKGGIGKSTVATNLAVALAEQKLSSVVIVDLDNGFGDVAGMLDLRPERTISDLARDVDRIEHDDLKKYLIRHEPSGLDVLAGPSVLEWRKVSVDDVRRTIDLLAMHYDNIVLDTSGVLNELSEMAVEVATMVLWVTTTEFASVKDTIEALRALKSLSYPQDRIRIVMNGISPDDSVRPTALQDALQREVFWNIPYDRKLRQGTHLGQPIVVSQGQSITARSFRDLATVISGGRLGGSNRKILGGMKWRPGTQPVPAEGS